jgi:Domain of unknown function (DUF1330)
MSAYVIFDVEIRDLARYQEFMKGVKPALDAAGARYLARGAAGQRRGARVTALRMSVRRTRRGSAKGRLLRLENPHPGVLEAQRRS